MQINAQPYTLDVPALSLFSLILILLCLHLHLHITLIYARLRVASLYLVVVINSNKLFLPSLGHNSALRGSSLKSGGNNAKLVFQTLYPQIMR